MTLGSPVQPGDILLDRYRVEHVLGRGGMGVVVAARHMSLGQLFAIKVLLPAAAEYPQAIERFLREARSAAQLKSEHVAKVVDVGRLETGSSYMVMEHLDGADLKQLLRRRGPLTVEEVVTYVLQVCDALSEAHSLGIVHRDIKPANLFLARRPNGTPCIKVLDFGISKQLGGDAVDLTNTNTSFGSPLYMSPEQMARAKSVDTRTDLWSIGIVIYELVTGTTPFAADSVPEVVARVLQEEAEPPSLLRPGLPAWLDKAVLGCLQKDRSHRFQSVADLIRALSVREETTTIPLRRGSLPSLTLERTPTTAVPTGVTAIGANAETTAPGESPVGLTKSSWGGTGRQRAGRFRRSGLLGAIGVLLASLMVVGLWRGLRWSWEIFGHSVAEEAPEPIAVGSSPSVLPFVTEPTAVSVAVPNLAAPNSSGLSPPQTGAVRRNVSAPSITSGKPSTPVLPSSSVPSSSTSSKSAKPKAGHEPLD